MAAFIKPVRYTGLTVSQVFEDTHDTKTLTIDLAGNELIFYPGQFVMLSVRVNGKTEARAFSMSSSPTQKKEMEITVKEYTEGTVSRRRNPRLHRYRVRAGSPRHRRAIAAGGPADAGRRLRPAEPDLRDEAARRRARPGPHRHGPPSRRVGDHLRDHSQGGPRAGKRERTSR